MSTVDRDREPNLTLYNLRDAVGESQQDLAEALNLLAAENGHQAGITANQVSRWERGVVRPQPLYRRLLAEHFKVSVETLGLTRQREHTERSDAEPDLAAASPETPPPTEGDVEEWLRIRASLNAHRVPLAIEASQLYEPTLRVGDTGLIARPEWIAGSPIPLEELAIAMEDADGQPKITGVEPAGARHRPMGPAGRPYTRYSQAIRDLARPRLYDNRLAYRLTGVNLDNRDPSLSMGMTTYFSVVDVAELLAHEFAAARLAGAQGALPFRQLIDDPFDLARRPMLPSIDTLTIRKSVDGPSFVLHDRSAGNVAVAGGMLHIMPAGVFQPSSVLPAAQAADFDIWRNMVREYAEEFLGSSEHGGDGQPADYAAEPLAGIDGLRRTGQLRVFVLGVALDALTLWGEVLTVAVIDDDAYDTVFSDLVEQNDEGAVVRTGKVHRTAQLPFTEHMVKDLLAEGRLAPAAAGCLNLAWQHRRTILGDT